MRYRHVRYYRFVDCPTWRDLDVLLDLRLVPLLHGFVHVAGRLD